MIYRSTSLDIQESKKLKSNTNTQYITDIHFVPFVSFTCFQIIRQSFTTVLYIPR